MTQKEIKKASFYTLKETLSCLHRVKNLLSDYCHVIDENDSINILIQTNILNIVSELEQREENYYNLLDSNLQKSKP